MLKKGDFHMHSKCSDGNLTPSELVKYAKVRKVDIISLTDHNNVEGLNEAIEEGKRSGVVVIPGVELSTKYKNNKVHILGYFKDNSFDDELFKEVLNCNKKGNLKTVKKLININVDFIEGNDKLSVEAGIALLKFFGASVVLAHPVLLSKECFNVISKYKFQGIEAKYFKNTEEETEYFINFAQKRNIFYTAGSDFHTRIEQYRVHGLIGDVYLNEGEIETFLSKSGLKIWVDNF